MTDIPSVTPPSSAPANMPPSSSLTDAPVLQAPPALTSSARAVQTSGTVLSSNPQKQQLSIQTPQGEIIVQSQVALPADTPVSINLLTTGNETRATVFVARQGAAAQISAQTLAQQANTQDLQTLEAAIAPSTQTSTTPPALQEGSTVMALQLPPSAAPLSAPLSASLSAQGAMGKTGVPAAFLISQIAAALETLKETGLKDVRSLLPLPVPEELFTTTDTESALKKLPQKTLEGMAQIFFPASQETGTEDSSPLLLRLLSASLPQEADATSPSLPSADRTAVDHNLLHVARAQLLAKATQETMHPSTAPRGKEPEALLPLASMLDIMAAAPGEDKPSLFPALLRQFMPQVLKGQLPPPQSLFRLHVLKILPPETSAAQLKSAVQKISTEQARTPQTPPEGQKPAAASIPDIQIATVETATSGGQPILKMESGHFLLTAPANLPAGSKIILTSTPMSLKEILQSAQSFVVPMPESMETAQKSSWPALQQALQALSSTQGEAAAAMQTLHNTLPTPTQRLVPTALFFLAALSSGDIKSWLGEKTLQTLAKVAGQEAADRLSGDFGKLSAQSKTSLPGGWRTISIPLRHQEQISQMQFYVRRQNDRDQKEKSGMVKPATRFILNMTFSRLGPLQLDGYIHKKAFDMVLRTEDRLPLDMRQELMKRFAAGLAQVDRQGSISFQTRQQGWMVPEEAPRTRADV